MRNFIYAMALVMTAPAYAQTSPEAPVLTAGAEFKGLRFDWEPVAGATWYELEYKANQNAAFVKKGSNLAASATSYQYRFPLHLFDWTYARYRLAACNSSGCSRSSEISVSSLRRYAVGYFKAAASTSNLLFGYEIDITPDGLNYVTTAPGEMTDSSGFPTGAVYVFRRGADGEWLQRARLVPPAAPVQRDPDGRANRMNVRISADGNTVVVGMQDFYHEVVEEGSTDDNSGEVFVFHFNGTSWARSRLSTGAGVRGAFGYWVSVNDAGDLIAVGSGKSFDAQVPRHAFIYRKTNGSWQNIRDIQARPGREYCSNGALSGDGSTLVQNCRRPNGEGEFVEWVNYVRTHSGPNWTVREEAALEMAPVSDYGIYSVGLAVDRTGSTIAAHLYMEAHGGDGPGEVHVFHRDGALSRVAIFTPGAWTHPEGRTGFGSSVAISDDGGTIAVGNTGDTGRGTGPRAAPLNPGGGYSGAVYVYRLKNTWRLANIMKPNYIPNMVGVYDNYGRVVALSGNGQTLIVGNNQENSSAQGIGGDWSNVDAPSSGAVWMY